MYFTGEYGKSFSKLRYTKTSINVPCFKKCRQGKNDETNDTEEGKIEMIKDPETDFVSIRKKKKNIDMEDDILVRAPHHKDMSIESESSYNYSSGDDEIETMLDGEEVSNLESELKPEVRIEKTSSGKEIKIMTI